ncbi:hypothetical protein I3842_02G118300 [Carya illinoinensis]|uniref:Uncharacterized protein n=1 Tax=Carya illinoinensis TaxID=32201 RepID=A0A922FRM9_CARIL|nr:hypothetical protein I3842_02G118300 [Carya illinoinensis]
MWFIWYLDVGCSRVYLLFVAIKGLGTAYPSKRGPHIYIYIHNGNQYYRINTPSNFTNKILQKLLLLPVSKAINQFISCI